MTGTFGFLSKARLPVCASLVSYGIVPVQTKHTAEREPFSARAVVAPPQLKAQDEGETCEDKMADDPKALALDACDEALKTSIANIASVLLNAFISSKSDNDRKKAMDRAQKGVQLTKETHSAMKEIVGTVFT